MINLALFFKKILFPGIDIATRKRMKFTKYFKSGNIITLDAGCGNGAFSFEAHKKGNRVIGIDFDGEKLSRCEKYRDYLKINPQLCRFKIFNIYDLPKLNELFEQIICFETLEHLKDDQMVIHLFAKILKPGGFLHICVPNANRQPYYGEIISKQEDGGHIRLGYTFDQLNKILGRENFKIINQDTAVGFFGQKIISIFNWINLNLLKNEPNITNNFLRTLIFLIFYPITYLDIFIPYRPLIIYVMAKKI